ncbi:MAG: sn-glycerol-3-phosphate ABC transporter ATP-binding protein UgpC [Hallerella porci]|uniref:ABC transporter ATP-binding protein n=1 Tax=Hallerella porci TaxID=1945871 RepID=UPI002A7EBDA7|nr:sn-glycerol-3-phosphate ABC transporter ATP-binding protein UgpC [Hallerella porci]MDY3921281.1 sn-glycerol-3-phosphate ABC transporter ATP-binding protein UgpC [Hallerella porci]
MAEAKSAIELSHVSKAYPGEEDAVKDISLSIREGEFIVLVGPSGCGKSSVLRMIAGLETPTAGKIFLHGRDAENLEPKDRDIAMVFQTHALYPHMTVRENLEFALRIRGIYSAKEIQERIREAVEMLGLETILDRKPKHLSGGQKQRVALGRALVRKPKIFLFDEPLSGLDARMKNQMCVELGRLHSRLQATMVFVTHDQNEAMTMGDRVVCFSEGKIKQVGTPMELYTHPANEFVAGFIGIPPMNIFAAQWTKDGLFFEKAAFTFPVSEEFRNRFSQIPRLRVGVRPEFFVVSQASPSSIAVTVEVVERLGFESLIYAQNNAQSFVLRVPPTESFAVGEKIYLSLDEKNIHLFDISTGECIL